MVRRSGPGPSLYRSPADQDAGLYVHRRRDAGARHRRQHRDLLAARCRGPEAAAGSRRRRARDVVRAFAGRQGGCRGRLGPVHAFQLPAVRASRNSPRRSRIDRRRDAEREIQSAFAGRYGAAAGLHATRLRRFLRHAWRGAVALPQSRPKRADTAAPVARHGSILARSFNGPDDVIGDGGLERRVQTIIGVTPPGFTGLWSDSDRTSGCRSPYSCRSTTATTPAVTG